MTARRKPSKPITVDEAGIKADLCPIDKASWAPSIRIASHRFAYRIQYKGVTTVGSNATEKDAKKFLKKLIHRARQLVQFGEVKVRFRDFTLAGSNPRKDEAI